MLSEEVPGSAESPLVSVIVPSFNALDSLVLALGSLKCQTFQRWEGIIVDDGSTDGTWAFLQTLRDSRFKVFRNPQNLGRGASRAAGMRRCRGEFIGFLDADDFLHPDKLTLQVGLMRRAPALAFCSTGVSSFDREMKLRTTRRHVGLGPKTYEPLDRIRFSPASVLLRRGDIGADNFREDFRELEDLEFFNRLYAGRTYQVIPEVLYFYGEFSSASRRKIIRRYFVAEKIRSRYSGEHRLWGFATSTLRRLMGVLLGFFLLLFGSERLLLRRGRKPTAEECQRFEFALTRAKTATDELQ